MMNWSQTTSAIAPLSSRVPEGGSGRSWLYFGRWKATVLSEMTSATDMPPVRATGAGNGRRISSCSVRWRAAMASSWTIWALAPPLRSVSAAGSLERLSSCCRMGRREDIYLRWGKESEAEIGQVGSARIPRFCVVSASCGRTVEEARIGESEWWASHVSRHHCGQWKGLWSSPEGGFEISLGLMCSRCFKGWRQRRSIPHHRWVPEGPE